MAEAAIAVAVAGWFLAPAIKEVMDWARSKLGNGYQFHKDFEDNREKLTEALESMHNNIEAMKKYSITQPYDRRILWTLLDAIQEAAEEFMHKFMCEVTEAGTRRNIIVGRGSATELKELLRRSEDGNKESGELLKRLQRGVQYPNRSHEPEITTSMPTVHRRFGYEKEQKNLLSELTSVGAGETRVVGIIGHGGIGKTELARWAFNHRETTRKFELRIWVSVSGMFNQDVLSEQIAKSTFDSAHSQMGTRALHDGRLESILGSARSYLLVLDDVCNDEASDGQVRIKTWETVLAPFKRRYGYNRGNMILLTSRAQICLDTLGSSICMDARPRQISLDGIVDTALLNLLRYKASIERTHNRSAVQVPQEQLEAIVGKLHGSPLAAEKVATRWRNVTGSYGIERGSVTQRSALANIKYDVDEGVLAEVHLSSFEVLPLHLQRCLAFCSIFPTGWRFEAEKLTRMWTALGFVESPRRRGGSTVDHVAKEYLDALVRRSLFQPKADTGTGRHVYVIHEHIHSMIRSVCPSYYHMIHEHQSGRSSPLLPTVRHLSVATDCLGDVLRANNDGLKKIRTLLVFQPRRRPASPSASSEIVNDYIKKFKGVRVLDFSDTCISEVPSGVDKLNHLRYLGLPSTTSCLSDQVTKLLLLQTLSVSSSSSSRYEGRGGRLSTHNSLHQDMHHLINLRHLDLAMKDIAKIAFIGSMTMLQDSVEFHARRTPQGHEMRELGGLNSLRRTLTIKCLDKVRSRDEAESARLRDKEHVKILELEWGQQSVRAPAAEDRRSAERDLDVLQGLRPHRKLEYLKIQNYIGTRSPNWLEEDRNSLEMLRSLRLINCWKWKLERLRLGCHRNLVNLEVERLHSVKMIDVAFCGRLQTMRLSNMAELDEWRGRTGGNGRLGSGMFTSLREVTIVRCPKLRVLEGLLCCRHSLTRLHVEDCPQVKARFVRSRFRDDLQTNERSRHWPCRLSFAHEEPPPPPRAHGGMYYSRPHHRI